MSGVVHGDDRGEEEGGGRTGPMNGRSILKPMSSSSSSSLSMTLRFRIDKRTFGSDKSAVVVDVGASVDEDEGVEFTAASNAWPLSRK